MYLNDNNHVNSATTFFTADADQFASNYSNRPSFNDRLNLFLAAVKRAAPAPAMVLDFGCGPGVIASAVAGMGYDVLGTDGSVGMVQKSNCAAAAIGLSNLRFKLVDATSATFPDESFDIIICSSVLEYLPKDIDVLSRLAASLKFGGSLLVSIPNAWSLIGMTERAVRFLRRTYRLDIGRHFDYSLRHYSTSRFTKQLSLLGLEVQRRTSFEFPLFGHGGVRLSRVHALGAMNLLEARRNPKIFTSPASAS